MWPPGYYIWRDRVPFFLSIIYLYRHRLPDNLLKAWGWYLTGITTAATGASLGVALKGLDMSYLIGLHWSLPSPIEWGTMIILCTATLQSRGIPIFESYYLSHITAMGGGWLYEFLPILFQPNFDPIRFFKVNAVKVFFVEFQVLCLPILAYIITKTKKYNPPKLIIPTGLTFLAFSAFNNQITQYVRDNLIYSYCWYVRLPAIAFLDTVLYGVWPRE